MALTPVRTRLTLFVLAFSVFIAAGSGGPDQAFACVYATPEAPTAAAPPPVEGPRDAGSVTPPIYRPGEYRQCPDEDFGYWYNYVFTPWLNQFPNAVQNTVAGARQVAENAAGVVEDEAQRQIGEQTPTPPENMVEPPAPVGRAVRGETLTASEGVWRGAQPISYSYEWRRCDDDGEICEQIPEASGLSYQLQVEDVDFTIRVMVTASNGGSSYALSGPTALVEMDSAPGCAQGKGVKQVPSCWRKGVNAIAFNPGSFTLKDDNPDNPSAGENRVTTSGRGLKKLKKLGATTVVLPVFLFVTKGDGTVETKGDTKEWGTLTRGDLYAAACRVNKNPGQRNLVIKVHLKVDGGDHTDYDPTGSELTKFRDSYRKEVLRLAKTALQLRADGFVIANELTKLTDSDDDAYWTNLITGKKENNGDKKSIRQQEQGLYSCTGHEVLKNKVAGGGTQKLYIGANHDALDNFNQTNFWDKLDYIGISAYFPLITADDSSSPSADRIRAGWRFGADGTRFDNANKPDRETKSALVRLDRVHRRFPNQPIVFTELGYAGRNGAALTPNEELQGSGENPDLRDRLLDEAFRYWSETNPSWLKGIWAWTWSLRPSEYSSKPLGFNFRPYKSATKLVCRWLKKTETACDSDDFNKPYSVDARLNTPVDDIDCDELEQETGSEDAWDLCTELEDPDPESMLEGSGPGDSVGDPPSPRPESLIDEEDPLGQAEDPDGPTPDDVIDDTPDDEDDDD